MKTKWINMLLKMHKTAYSKDGNTKLKKDLHYLTLHLL